MKRQSESTKRIVEIFRSNFFPDHTIYRDMYSQALHYDNIADMLGNE